MREIIDTVSNPTWWLLTVFVGLLLNLAAPLVSRLLEKQWLMRSQRRATAIKEEEKQFQDDVALYRKRADGVVQCKMDCVYHSSRLVYTVAFYLFLMQVCFAVPVLVLPELGNLLAAIVSIGGFFSIYTQRKIWLRAIAIQKVVWVDRPEEQLTQEKPNQTPEPTTMAVTPPAAQEPRQP